MYRILLFISLLLVLLAFRYLPLWAAVGVGLLFILNLRYLVRSRMMQSYEAKGAVLRNARVQVHSLQPALPPPADSVDDETASVRWFLLELSITPAQPDAQWAPNLLDPCTPGGRDGEYAGEISEFAVKRGDSYAVLSEVTPVTGEQRLRLHIGLLPDVERFALRYYFETFGSIEVPRDALSGGGGGRDS